MTTLFLFVSHLSLSQISFIVSSKHVDVEKRSKMTNMERMGRKLMHERLGENNQISQL